VDGKSQQNKLLTHSLGDKSFKSCFKATPGTQIQTLIVCSYETNQNLNGSGKKHQQREKRFPAECHHLKCIDGISPAQTADVPLTHPAY
jgi:hypothetical protein